MDNEALIGELRDWAEVQGAGSLGYILNVAADRIEEMSQRVSIISENLDNVEAEFDEMLRDIGVRES
jgi:hypothetical protein